MWELRKDIVRPWPYVLPIDNITAICGDDLMQLSGVEPMNSKPGGTGRSREIDRSSIGPCDVLSNPVSFLAENNIHEKN